MIHDDLDSVQLLLGATGSWPVFPTFLSGTLKTVVTCSLKAELFDRTQSPKFS